MTNVNIRAILLGMSRDLQELLENEEPVELKSIERALASRDALTDDQDAALSALVWSRCVFDRKGMLATVLDHACAKRIDVLPDHLERVGANEAASAVRELREAIPLETPQVQAGLTDWIETEKDVQEIAEELDGSLEDIRHLLWEFMRDLARQFGDIPVPTTRLGNILSLSRKLLGPGDKG